MRPSFHPRLINGHFSDPGLYIPFLFEKRALMFDLGDLHSLASRELLKITHVFVTHTHVDHFIGFDSLLRIFLDRDKILHLFGPPAFFEQVEGKLAGYNWNLVSEFKSDFKIEVSEVHHDRILTKRYVCIDRFAPEARVKSRKSDKILLREPAFSVEGILLDHRIPCLGFSLNEGFSVNIIKEGLKELGLSVGPWLNRFKAALYQKTDPESEFLVPWDEKNGVHKEKRFLLGNLSKKIARISPGQKITYITDVRGSKENRRKIIDFSKGSDKLFIEAAFMEKDIEIARKKYHLTAKEAGEIASEAGVKKMELFHFSPRYEGNSLELQKEAYGAFRNRNF